MKKNFLLTALISSFTLATFNFSALAEEKTNEYKDVSSTHWAYKSLQTLADKYGIKLGYTDGTFKGDKNLTRYEVAALIVQVLKKLENVKIEKEEIRIVDNLGKDYSKEIEQFKAEYGIRIQSLEDQLDMFEAEQEARNVQMKSFMNSIPFTISGDTGLRYQLVTKELGKDFANQVGQMRFSLSLDSREINPIGYGVRVVSGGLNRTVLTWWKFSDFFNKVPFNLDRFFLTYRPSNFFEVTAGRFRDVFSNSELYFDDEISPQGALQTLKFTDVSPFLREFSITAGEYVINMDKDFGNTFSLNASSELKLNLGDFIGLNLKGGYYDYTGLDNIAQANKLATDKKLEPKFVGNTMTNSLDDKGNFKSQFKIANGFAKLIFRLHENFPLTVSGDYLYNLGASTDNQAYQVSAKLGTTKDVGNFFIGYNLKHLQKDATISLFVEDQLGGTDLQGHEGTFGIKLFPSTIFSASLLAKQAIKDPKEFTYTFRGNLIQGF